eukprot:149165-Chlamydomonas_euryale.AAC.5
MSSGGGGSGRGGGGGGGGGDNTSLPLSSSHFLVMGSHQLQRESKAATPHPHLPEHPHRTEHPHRIEHSCRQQRQETKGGKPSEDVLSKKRRAGRGEVGEAGEAGGEAQCAFECRRSSQHNHVLP